MRLNFIHQEVCNGSVKLLYIHTHDNVADLFTKALPTDLLVKHRETALKGFGGRKIESVKKTKPKSKSNAKKVVKAIRANRRSK